MNQSIQELLRASCARNGIDFDSLDFTHKTDAPTYRCETCLDRGMVSANVPYGHPQFGKVHECPNEECPAATNLRQARFRRLSNLSQLPVEYRQWEFSAWKTLMDNDPKLPRDKRRMTNKLLGLGSAWAFVNNWAHGHYFTLQDACKMLELSIDPRELPDTCKNSLMLQGAPGTGKTSLAACAVNFLLAVNRAVIYARVSDVLNAVKERYAVQQDVAYEYDYGNTAEAVKATFKRAPVLILDEFNLSKYSDHDLQVMEDIMRYRMANNLPTLMTCNISFDEFQDESNWGYRTGHAVQGMAHWITMGGVELRPRNRPVVSL
jgi:hypothetical protein